MAVIEMVEAGAPVKKVAKKAAAKAE
jgi:hypothetical protein